MPLYDYRCDHCCGLFEKTHAINSKEPVHCEHCSSIRVTRRLLGCVYSFGGVKDEDLHKTQQEHDKKFMAGKQRVGNLLQKLKSPEGGEKTGPRGCIYHTRKELESEYGSLF